ncbi:MAG: hypothetical protein HQ567_04795 [Candidatus Nealsonbacteria bacterium]|nr:hypothetical protein [Candidatus Nealsonbacteria bacterium]
MEENPYRSPQTTESCPKTRLSLRFGVAFMVLGPIYGLIGTFAGFCVVLLLTGDPRPFEPPPQQPWEVLGAWIGMLVGGMVAIAVATHISRRDEAPDAASRRRKP